MSELTAQTLIEHVCRSVTRTENNASFISPEALAISGMSSPKVRHLVNNLCSHPDISYLEVGSWKGSTLCAALSGNHLRRACAYENFAEFTDPAHCESSLSIRDQLLANISAHRGDNLVELVEADFFTQAPPPGEKFNVYLYDGIHTAPAHYYQPNAVKPHLARFAIILVDDWFCEVSNPKQMTLRAFDAFGYYIHLFIELPKGNVDGYWGGQGLFVVENR